MNFRKTLVTFLALVILLLSAGVVFGQAYYVQPGDSLYSIATRNGTTVSALQQSNNLGSVSVYPGQVINIGTATIEAKTTNYTVRSGDTLYLVAQRFGVTVTDLKRANGLSSNYLEIGQRLTIPSGSTGTQTTKTYQVQRGDTLYLIAKAYGVTVTDLKNANNLVGDELRSGQILKIPAVSSGGSTSTGSSSYTVKSGDTLYLIAQRYGITVAALCQANNLSSSAMLTPGQQLAIPSTSGSTSNATSFYGYAISQSDKSLLARLVSAESDGEPYSGQVAVAATILNRLRDPRYPKTISGIIYQVDSGRYQYSPVLDGRINIAASPSAVRAVDSALTGWDPSNGGNGFYNPDKTVSEWVRSQAVTAVIGNHIFFSY